MWWMFCNREPCQVCNVTATYIPRYRTDIYLSPSLEDYNWLSILNKSFILNWEANRNIAVKHSGKDTIVFLLGYSVLGGAGDCWDWLMPQIFCRMMQPSIYWSQHYYLTELKILIHRQVSRYLVFGRRLVPTPPSGLAILRCLLSRIKLGYKVII